jgi:hypothetical protein
MMPEIFAASLTARLRSRGVNALPEDVRSFTADIGQRMTDAPDLDHYAELFIQARQLTVHAQFGWRERTGRGAIWGLLFSPVVVVVAAVVWGAVVRPAPCSGGGGPDMMGGIACGLLLFPIFYGIPTVIVSALFGAIIGAIFGRR